MARRPKLHTWLKPGSEEYKAVVHAYYHLQMAQRFDVLMAIGDITGAPIDMRGNFWEQSEGHWHAFEIAIAPHSQFRGYLLERMDETREWRVVHQTMCIIRDGEKHASEKARVFDRKSERQRKARYN